MAVMPASAQPSIVPGAATSAHDIVAFARGWSIEATAPSAAEIASLATIVPAGTEVYLTAVPTRDPFGQVEAAVRLRRAGLSPVPHVAVRHFSTAAALDGFLARMAGEAGVDRILVIAGDRDPPAGAFRSATEAIDSGLMRHGLREIGIAGYPDGHPRMSQNELDRVLAEKIDIATQIGLSVYIVTQFCFEPEPIASWIGRLRDFGVENPVRIGLAGPTSVATLLRYAGRCGVRASAQALARQAGLARQMFGRSAPDRLVRALAAARAGAHLGEVAPHFFSFGGIVATARWAAAVAAGHITPDGAGGFQVAPPPPDE